MTIKHERPVDEHRSMTDTKGRPAREQQLMADKKDPGELQRMTNKNSRLRRAGKDDEISRGAERRAGEDDR